MSRRHREGIEMVGVTETQEGFAVHLMESGGRLVIEALNEAGCCGTEVDVLQLIGWLRANRPDLLADVGPKQGDS